MTKYLAKVVASATILIAPSLAFAIDLRHAEVMIYGAVACILVNLVVLILHTIAWKRGSSRHVYLALFCIVLSAYATISLPALLVMYISGPLTVISLVLSISFLMQHSREQ